MKTNQFLLSTIATVVALGLIAVAVLTTSSGTQTQAQATQDEPFGGEFTSITEICCDGTMILEHEAVSSDFPDGSFQTSWSMDAYATLFYWPLPQTCAIGFVRQSGSCQTVSSECYSSDTPDYTITMIGTSLPGCSI